MRAAYVEAPGPPESIVVGERPDPVAGPGGVVVRVSAASVNPIDLYLRAGIVAMPIPIPYIVGCDLAGVVESLGPEVSGLHVGDRVWGSNQGLLGRQGVTAQRAAVDQRWLYPTPDNLDDAHAAAMALVGITAHLGLFHRGGLQAGESVYVAGGAGGVGSMVVQMAKAAGARVATSAGRAENLAYCRDELKADHVFDYKHDDLATEIKAFAPEGVDLWFETRREPDLEISVPLLRRRGRMILMAGRTAKPTLPLGSFYTRDCAIHGFAMFNADPADQRRAAEAMNRWASAGLLKADIGRTFPIEEAAEAHRLLEANTLHGAGTLRGKVVIAIG